MLVKELYKRLNDLRAERDMTPVPEELYLILIAKMAVEGKIKLGDDSVTKKENKS